MKPTRTLLPLALLCAPALLQAQEEETTGATSAADAAANAAADAAMAAAMDEPYPRGPTPSEDTLYVAWVQPVDYPPASWVAKEEGAAAYEIDVDADRKALGCRITESSGFPALDAATCPAVLSRATFEPALDENNNRVAGVYADTAYWYISPPKVNETMIEVAYLMGADGKLRDCEVVRQDGTPPEGFARQPCPVNDSSADPYRDETGNPVARRVRIKLSVDIEPES